MSAWIDDAARFVTKVGQPLLSLIEKWYLLLLLLPVVAVIAGVLWYLGVI